MDSDFQPLSPRTQFQLALGHPITLTDVRDITRVEVERGTVWLTQSGREEDVFLMCGDSMAPNNLKNDLVLESVSANATVRIITIPRTSHRAAARMRKLRTAHALRTAACKLDPQPALCQPNA
jgi:hypothetical protein